MFNNPMGSGHKAMSISTNEAPPILPAVEHNTTAIARPSHYTASV
jgi:hypothetical protein